jgi:predicted NBD/HSP70 family sugar kinase
MAVTDFKGRIIDHEDNLPFELEATEKSFSELCVLIKKAISDMDISLKEILVCGVNLSGRVNYQTGFSFSYFLGEGKPLTDLLESQLGVPVTIENDSRAMTYAEYLAGDCGNIKNMLFINASWGLGMGMILDGNLYFGKSGYSGEFGHFPMLNNNQICRCGKIGCLETGASGSALHRIFIEKIEEGKNSSLKDKYQKEGDISLGDILKAVQEEDVLAIEAIEEVGFVLGRAIAGLIKIFNPEMVVIGGKLPMAEDSLMLPVKSEINKYSFNIISKDTTIRFSKLGQMAGPLGACLLSRSKMLGLI